MSKQRLPEVIDIGRGAAKRMAAFVAARATGPLRLVADSSTWAAMGKEVEAELKAASLAFRPTIFEERYLAADARSVFRLLVDDESAERLYISLGSGTITDIVRFAAHRTGRNFVSVATAASVDAYSSIVAPMVIDGIKRTYPTMAPLAVFADPELLARAPRAMTSAGFGDILCKFSAIADWRLGTLVWDEPYDEAIAQRSIAAAKACVTAVADIGAAKPEGVAILMSALVESGLCMAEAGHSRPASGAEHQYSHFWEMRLLKEGRPPILHGLKVGIGTLETARLWDRIRTMDRAAADRALAGARLPDPAAEVARIRAVYGKDADEMVAGQRNYLAMDEGRFAGLKARLSREWERIQGFAASVPSALETERLLAVAGCPTKPGQLGLGEREVEEGLACAHYLRDRFTVKKLTRLLGIE